MAKILLGKKYKTYVTVVALEKGDKGYLPQQVLVRDALDRSASGHYVRKDDFSKKYSLVGDTHDILMESGHGIMEITQHNSMNVMGQKYLEIKCTCGKAFRDSATGSAIIDFNYHALGVIIKGKK